MFVIDFNQHSGHSPHRLIKIHNKSFLAVYVPRIKTTALNSGPLNSATYHDTNYAQKEEDMKYIFVSQGKYNLMVSQTKLKTNINKK